MPLYNNKKPLTTPNQNIFRTISVFISKKRKNKSQPNGWPFINLLVVGLVEQEFQRQPPRYQPP